MRTQWGPGASARTLVSQPVAIEMLRVPAAEKPAEGASAVGALVPCAEQPGAGQARLVGRLEGPVENPQGASPPAAPPPPPASLLASVLTSCVLGVRTGLSPFQAVRLTREHSTGRKKSSPIFCF